MVNELPLEDKIVHIFVEVVVIVYFAFKYLLAKAARYDKLSNFSQSKFAGLE